VEYLIHVANVLYVFSYSVRDILWLRLLTVVALLALIPFYYSRDLVQAIYWNVLFLAVNLVQLYRLLLERRPVKLTVEQQRLYRGPFRALSPREFVRLLDVAAWRDYDAGATLVEQGSVLDGLTLIADGEVAVNVDGDDVSTLASGQFVGEVAFVTGESASASVIARTQCRCVRWRTEKLRSFLQERADIRATMQDIIGNDLAQKLRAPARASSPALDPAPA
jgi:hypothetical protein